MNPHPPPRSDSAPHSTAAPDPGVPAAAGPVAESHRLHALDVARGFALLGIFLVNIQSFAEPFGRFIAHTPEGSDLGTQACFFIQKIFCEGKFYPLFSMLFGMGLVLQMGSVGRRGGNFVPLYLRRLGVLLALGMFHALLLWYGDILAIYSVCGLLLLLCRKWSARTLIWVGIALVGASTVVAGGLGALGMTGSTSASASAPAQSTAPVVGDAAPQTAAADGTGPTAETPAPKKDDELARLAEHSPFLRLMQAYRDGELQAGPEHPLYMELESRAYREGPWLDAFLFRVLTWIFFAVFLVVGMGWHIVGMFFIGAGLMKFGIFDPPARSARTRLFRIGLCVGLPGCVAAAAIPALTGAPWTIAIGSVLLFLCGPLLSLAYLMGAALLAESGRAQLLTGFLRAAGRMALTNYLAQTVLSTWIFYWWGLAQFASWTRPQMCLLVVAVFAGQCVLSVLWLHTFRFGPVEYVWRSITYLRLEPMLRRRAAVAA